MRALANCPRAGSVRTLEVAMGGLTDAGAEALLASPHFRPDMDLSMTNNMFSAAVAKRVNARFKDATYSF